MNRSDVVVGLSLIALAAAVLRVEADAYRAEISRVDSPAATQVQNSDLIGREDGEPLVLASAGSLEGTVSNVKTVRHVASVQR